VAGVEEVEDVVFCWTPRLVAKRVRMLQFETHSQLQQVDIWHYELCVDLALVPVLVVVINLHDYVVAKVLQRVGKYFES